MDTGRLVAAVGLTVWIGGLAGGVLYVSRRMRFPKSVYAGNNPSSPGWFGVVVGSTMIGVAAYSVPNVVWVCAVFASGIVIYALVPYLVALRFERRRALRLGLPEPGTAGTKSVAEFVAALALALLCAAAALALTVYGIANELSGNPGEGGAGLAFGAGAWFLALVMGLFSSPLFLWRRRLLDAPTQAGDR